jgi:hypothetical protein
VKERDTQREVEGERGERERERGEAGERESGQSGHILAY